MAVASSDRVIPNFTTVRTLVKISSDDFLAAKRLKGKRRPDSPGYIVDALDQGSLGFAYLIQHEGSDPPAIYFPKDLEPQPAYWRITWIEVGSGTPYRKEVATHREALKFVKDIAQSINALPGVENIFVEGPFYVSKELEEGPLDSKSLFDHLKES